MKKILTIVAFVFAGITAAIAQTAEAIQIDPNVAKFEWKSDLFEYGNISQGTPATCKFEFINTGKSPLIINDVQRTCGCTNTDWSKEPIQPGEKGWVGATYSAASEGAFSKTITVVSNAETANAKLTFRGVVVKSADVSNGGSVPEQKTIFNSGTGGN